MPHPPPPRTPGEPRTPALERVRVDGKFFRAGAGRFYPKGVTYGPFTPDRSGDAYPPPEQARRDLALIRDLGANLVRVYTVPPPWFLELALAHELRLLVDIPWNTRSCFVERARERAGIRTLVGRAAQVCGRHPALFALSLVNELPPDVVRWSGPRAIEAFLDDLVETVRSVAPDCLCTFGNYPTTEFLHPRAVDFHCLNVYLHEPRPFRNYLARLQTLAGPKPLLLGECGIDALREGPARQAAILEWTLDRAFREGAAGTVVFSFTDDWVKEGRPVQDWWFGLTDHARQPRPAFTTVRSLYHRLPAPPPADAPRVSVVVASYNGATTLPACLDSLAQLNYPDYEVILVDDGSTDATAAIAARYPAVRYLRHETNQGLSTARNTGIAAADGEIVAFTDADCRADRDWLRHTVATLVDDDFAGVGGHNLAPADDSWVAAAVMASPGGPAHVMLTDRLAEHIPGCNMVFWKRALLEVGCFDPVFRQAGDDVDICWRLQHAGHRLGFSHAGFVWHARRSTVRAYLRQQHGYGEAEALLARKHPEHFNLLGGSLWQGRIYAPASPGLLTRRPMIYHGRFATGAFQGLYTATPSSALLAATSLEYHLLVTLPLLATSAILGWLLPLGLASAALSVLVCVAAALQAELPRSPRRLRSRPLVGLLFALQPVVRGWARHRERLFLRLTPLARRENLESLGRSLEETRASRTVATYHDPACRGRLPFLNAILGQLEQEHWLHRVDAGWGGYDLEVYGSRWSRVELTTVTEHPGPDGERLRCRFRTRWTLPARLLVGGTGLLALLLVAAFRSTTSWAWLALAAPALIALWLRRDQHRLLRVLAAFLDGIARAHGLQPDPAPPRSPAAAPPTAPPL